MVPKINWKQCLGKILKGQTKSINGIFDTSEFGYFTSLSGRERQRNASKYERHVRGLQNRCSCSLKVMLHAPIFNETSCCGNMLQVFESLSKFCWSWCCNTPAVDI